MLLDNEFSFKNVIVGDFPGGPVVKNLPARAGDMSSVPGPGRLTPHIVEQVSLCAAATEPAPWSPPAATTEPVPPTREASSMRSLCIVKKA